MWLGGCTYDLVDCPTQLTLIFMILIFVFHDKYQIRKYEKTQQGNLRWNRQQLARLAIKLGLLPPHCLPLLLSFHFCYIVHFCYLEHFCYLVFISKESDDKWNRQLAASHRAAGLLPLSCFCCQLTPCYCTLHTAFQMLPLLVFIGSTNTLKNQMVKSYCCFNGKLDCRWKKVDSVLSACNAVLSHPEN